MGSQARAPVPPSCHAEVTGPPRAGKWKNPCYPTHSRAAERPPTVIMWWRSGHGSENPCYPVVAGRMAALRSQARLRRASWKPVPSDGGAPACNSSRRAVAVAVLCVSSVVRLTLLYIWRFWRGCALPERSRRRREGSGCDSPGTVRWRRSGGERCETFPGECACR